MNSIATSYSPTTEGALLTLPKKYWSNETSAPVKLAISTYLVQVEPTSEVSEINKSSAVAGVTFETFILS